jgi:hypothetical protein
LTGPFLVIGVYLLYISQKSYLHGQEFRHNSSFLIPYRRVVYEQRIQFIFGLTSEYGRRATADVRSITISIDIIAIDAAERTLFKGYVSVKKQYVLTFPSVDNGVAIFLLFHFAFRVEFIEVLFGFDKGRRYPGVSVGGGSIWT